MSAAEVESRATATELRMRPTLRNALRIGSLLGAALILAGLLLTAHEGASITADGGTRFTLDGLASAFLHPSGPGLLFLGVVVLALTPLSRVTLAVSVFAAARDRPLLALTTFVLLALVATVVIGVLL